MTQPPTPPPRIITSLTPTARDPYRATIRVGTGHGKGTTAATLTTRLISDLGLYKGQVWDDTLAQAVEEAKDFDKAFRAASSRLARRAMSRQMIDDKLRQREHPTATRTAVLDRLETLGLIDDAGFGRMLIRGTLSRRPAGPMLLKQKLYAKGIRGALADQLVAEATDDPDAQRDAALAWAQKKLATMQRLTPETRQRRLYGQLARRGFRGDTIRHVMEALRDELHACEADLHQNT